MSLEFRFAATPEPLDPPATLNPQPSIPNPKPPTQILNTNMRGIQKLGGALLGPYSKGIPLSGVRKYWGSLLGGLWYLLSNYNWTYNCTYNHIKALKGLISGL